MNIESDHEKVIKLVHGMMGAVDYRGELREQGIYLSKHYLDKVVTTAAQRLIDEYKDGRRLPYTGEVGL